MDEEPLPSGVLVNATSMIRRRLLSAVIVVVGVPTLGIVLPRPEHCTGVPAIVDGQAVRCPEPIPDVWDVPLENRVTPEGPAHTGGVNP